MSQLIQTSGGMTKIDSRFSLENLKANPALCKAIRNFASSGQRGMEEVIQAFATMLETNKPQGFAMDL